MAVGTFTTCWDFTDDTSLGPYSLNNYHFINRGGDNLQDAAELFRDAFIEAMENEPGSDAALVSYISNDVSPTMRFWWKERGTTGTPNYMTTHTFELEGDARSLPFEVASCTTIKCEPHDGLRLQSCYNRQYIGPLNINALGTSGEPVNAFSQAQANFMFTLGQILDPFGLDGCEWVVLSQKDGTWGGITDGWVDTEFDTQRRRGQSLSYKIRPNI